MRRYSIGEVEKLLCVKQHVLRYWEKEIPFIEPRKDSFGRRAYTESDIGILMRLKHLLYEKRYTIEGAREALLAEMDGKGQDAKGMINEIRSDLLKLFFKPDKEKGE